MPVSPRFAASRILRRCSRSGRSVKRTAICVPPAKSMPNFSPFCTKIAKSPTAISSQEAPIANHLYLRKSMLVCRKSSIPVSLDRQSVDVLAPPVRQLEDRVRHEDGGEDGDQEAQDQGHRETLHGTGTELEEKDRGDDHGQVCVALKRAIAPRSMTAFRISARTAFSPESR